MTQPDRIFQMLHRISRQRRTIQRRRFSAKKEPPVEGAIGSLEVCRQTGATLRQLQWWDERGILKPWRHEEHRRWYIPAQVELIENIVELLAAGVPLNQARKLAGLEYRDIRVITKAQVIGETLVFPKLK